MIPVSAALKAHLALHRTTLATCWKVTIANGPLAGTVYGFTDHDRDLVVEAVTYQQATGYTRTDIASANDLSVDNLEVDGLLESPSITEADLHAGIWDNAAIEVFVVNYLDLTMGKLIVRIGNIGEVTVSRGKFTAELRGLMQRYSRQVIQLTQPGCRAELYDTRCKVDPTSFTVTGAITGVNADGVTLYDTSRTEPGPAGGIAITAITNSNPGHVTLASGTSFSTGEAISISGVVGMPLLNTTTFIRNLSGNTFDLGIDTSNTGVYGTYVSGGTVTPLGGESGYFDFGVISFTSGLNNGLSMEIRSYVPGQLTLDLPMPYAVQVGDAYSLKAGCDKAASTCIGKFSNILNFRGEPFLPGVDKIVQVGKQP